MEYFVNLTRGKIYVPLVLQCRYRKINIKHPRPLHPERRLLEEITKPVYPIRLANPAKDCTVLTQERFEILMQRKSSLDENKYEEFLIREVKKVFAGNRMIVAFQPESMERRLQVELGNRLLDVGVEPIVYPRQVVRKAIAGSMWSNLSPLIESHTWLGVSVEPRLTELINALKKLPQLTLLGGFVGDRLFTREGLMRYSRLPAIESLRGELVSVLNSPASRIRTLLGAQQQRLASSLDQYVKQGSDGQPIAAADTLSNELIANADVPANS